MVIIDTDVIISSIRGNAIAKQLIRKYIEEAHVSTITEIELYIGATNKSKKDIVEQVLQSHGIVQINKVICEIATRLVKTYNTANRSLLLPDAIIAATCIHKNCRLVTFNVKDYKFIKGLHLAM